MNAERMQFSKNVTRRFYLKIKALRKEQPDGSLYRFTRRKWEPVVKKVLLFPSIDLYSHLKATQLLNIIGALQTFNWNANCTWRNEARFQR